MTGCIWCYLDEITLEPQCSGCCNTADKTSMLRNQIKAAEMLVRAGDPHAKQLLEELQAEYQTTIILK